MEDEAVLPLCDQICGGLICFTSTVKEARCDPDFGLFNREIGSRTDRIWFDRRIIYTFIRVINPHIYTMRGGCLDCMLASSVHHEVEVIEFSSRYDTHYMDLRLIRHHLIHQSLCINRGKSQSHNVNQEANPVKHGDECTEPESFDRGIGEILKRG